MSVCLCLGQGRLRAGQIQRTNSVERAFEMVVDVTCSLGG